MPARGRPSTRGRANRSAARALPARAKRGARTPRTTRATRNLALLAVATTLLAPGFLPAAAPADSPATAPATAPATGPAGEPALPAGWTERPALGRHFQRAGVTGCLLFYDVLDDAWSAWNAPRCRQGFLPASTFKIFNAAIALDAGAASGPEHRFRWDGVKRELPAWNRDQTLATAIRDSAVWCFQDLARGVGAERMARYVRHLGYGNGDVSAGVDQFWLRGGMRVTAEEQVTLLRRLYHGTLPLAPRAQEIVRDLIVLERTPAWTLRGKTGTALGGPQSLFWLVGWVEQGDRLGFFALNLDGGKTSGQARHDVLRACLRDLGYLDGAPAASPAELPPPPMARRRPHVVEAPAGRREDPWHWLRNKKQRSVLSYLDAENAYLKAALRPARLLEDRIFHEILGRTRETDLSVPERRGDFWYFTRTQQGKQYPLHCRAKGSADGPEELLLDENVAIGSASFFSLGAFEPSPDQSILAWSGDTAGDEHYTLRFRDLANGRDLPDVIPDTAGEAAWAADGRTIFYGTRDAAERPYRAYRHVLGTPREQDVLVFEERDPTFNLSVRTTRDEAYVLFASEASTSSEVRYVPASTPTAQPRLFAPRRKNVEYYLDHRAGTFYVTTNDRAVNFQVFQVPAASTARSSWKVFVPHREDVRVDGVDAFERHVVVYERRRGLRALRVWDARLGAFRDVAFDEPVYTFWEAANPEFRTNQLRIHYTSLVTPESVYEVDLDTLGRTLLKRKEILLGYDPANYAQERLMVKSHDGVEVPVSLVYRRGLQRDGSNPAWLYGYGAYGISSEPYFSFARVSLLDRGFVVAIAHVRGGEELGRRWYLDGKLLKKRNSFLDFAACARALVEQGFTRPERLAINGGSAGGLLVGATAMLFPDLFGCVVADVPFVDAVTTMLDPTLPLTAQEYEEWGDPRKPRYYRYMLSYSPYDNVQARAYPPMLVTGGLNDPRVGFWEPAKWVAKLRHLKTDDHLLLLKTNVGAGHQGASGRYDRYEEIALSYTFVLHAFGLDRAPAR